jgi:hypothetical protein
LPLKGIGLSFASSNPSHAHSLAVSQDRKGDTKCTAERRLDKTP